MRLNNIWIEHEMKLDSASALRIPQQMSIFIDFVAKIKLGLVGVFTFLTATSFMLRAEYVRMTILLNREWSENGQI